MKTTCIRIRAIESSPFHIDYAISDLAHTRLSDAIEHIMTHAHKTLGIAFSDMLSPYIVESEPDYRLVNVLEVVQC